MLPGNLCISVGTEGLLCSMCASTYAPEMSLKLGEQLPASEEDEKRSDQQPVFSALSEMEWRDVAATINALRNISADLVKGIARGIVEAPAGHIGLLHYAKDIEKPPCRDNEPEKEYALRVKTHRMTRLYEILSAETVGRIEKIK